VAYPESSTAPSGAGSIQVFVVTHPFHPWCGRQFELFQVRQNWGEWRASFFDEQQRWRSVPLAWTSLAAIDPFVQVAAGRSLFRFTDLVRLSQLIASQAHAAGGREGR
jgi:hypothetical protein